MDMYQSKTQKNGVEMIFAPQCNVSFNVLKRAVFL